jgi:hypothetical protein
VKEKIIVLEILFSLNEKIQMENDTSSLKEVWILLLMKIIEHL